GRFGQDSRRDEHAAAARRDSLQRVHVSGGVRGGLAADAAGGGDPGGQDGPRKARAQLMFAVPGARFAVRVLGSVLGSENADAEPRTRNAERGTWNRTPNTNRAPSTAKS